MELDVTIMEFHLSVSHLCLVMHQKNYGNIMRITVKLSFKSTNLTEISTSFKEMMKGIISLRFLLIRDYV
jgi:hypothetical protein